MFKSRIYRVFGLEFASSIPLPALLVRAVGATDTPDVVIEYGETPASLADPQFRGIQFQTAPGEFLLRIDKLARYYVKDGSRITITPEVGADEQEILVFLMGSAMGALLHQRNILALHASAIAVDGGSVIIAGPSGVGKSTLAAGFHQRGCAFLTDDVCAVTTVGGIPAVNPGFPRLKLWADALKQMGTEAAGLQRVRRGSGPEKFSLPANGFQDTAVPVKTILILGTSDSDGFDIVEVTGTKKVDALLANTYRIAFLDGRRGKKSHFTQCAAVAAEAGLYRVVRPTRGFRLSELLDLLEERCVSRSSG